MTIGALRARGPERRMLARAGCVAGLLMFGGYATQTVGLEHTSPSTSAFITGLYVVITPVIESVMIRRFPRRPVLVGIVFAVREGRDAEKLGHQLRDRPDDVDRRDAVVAIALQVVAGDERAEGPADHGRAAQPGGLDHGVDGAGDVAAGRVGLEDGEGFAAGG
mgnify:CR=1 FL=1